VSLPSVKDTALPSALTLALSKAAVIVPHCHHGDFSLPSVDLALGKAFAECPKKDTRQRALYCYFFWRVLFVECGTRQSLCRVQYGLCRVPLALGKEADSSTGSASSLTMPARSEEAVISGLDQVDTKSCI
jgi:hypothetical protein